MTCYQERQTPINAGCRWHNR